MLRPRLGRRLRKLAEGKGLVDQLVPRKADGGGLAGRVSSLLGVGSSVGGKARQAEATSVTTVCTLCGVGDAITVELKPSGEGTAKPKVKGGGRLGACGKGVETIRRELGSPRKRAAIERLERPMVREGDDWIEVPWEGALTRVAWELLETRRKHGRDSLAFYCVGQLPIEDFWLAKKLFQGYLGTNNVGTNCEQCLVANGGGHELVFGTEGSFTRYEDLRDADVVLVIGSNPILNHPTLFQRYIKKSRAKVKVVVDPRRSETVRALCGDGDENMHIAAKSGGDVLLFLSVAHVLLQRGNIDEEWVSRHIDPHSRRAFEVEVLSARYAPGEVARTIACHPEEEEQLAAQIERLADLWAVRDGTGLKVCTVTSVGINQTSGSNGIAAILNLHMLTGQIGREGCGLIRLPGQANAAGALSLGLGSGLLPFRTRVGDRRARNRIADIWNVPEWFLNPVPGTTIARYPQDDRLKYIFLWGTDAARDFPNLPAWHARLRECFVVVVDPYKNPELMEFADVVLPARPATEKNGTIMNGERRFQRIRKIADPGFEAWSDTKIMVELAARIGYLVGPEELEAPPSTPAELEDLVASGNKDLLALNLYHGDDFRYPRQGRGEVDTEEIWNELVAASLGMHNAFVDEKGTPITYAMMEGPDGIRWQGEHRYQPDSRPDGALFPETFGDGWRKAELFMPPEKYRVDPSTFGDGDALNLITGRGHDPDKDSRANHDIYNSGRRSGGILLNERAHVWLHPEEAAIRRLEPGDPIRIWNDVGTITVPLSLSENVPRGHAWMSFHPTQEGNKINLLTTGDWLDEQTHQPLLKRLLVHIEKRDPDTAPLDTPFPAA